MKKSIAIIIALLMAASFAYAPSQRSDDAAPQIEIACGEFEFNDVNPEITGSIPAQELIFTNRDTKIVGVEYIESIFFTGSGVFYKDSIGMKKEIDESKFESGLRVRSVNTPLIIYKSSDNNGLPVFTVNENRINIKNSILDSDTNSNYRGIILQTSFENGCSYALSSAGSTTETQTLNFGDVKAFDLVDAEDEPIELVQTQVDATVLETPPTGCFDGDAQGKEKETLSYAYDITNKLLNDFCSYGNNKQVLQEAYCDENNKVNVKEFLCPSKCENGACVLTASKPKEFCIDTDQLEEKGLPENADEAIKIFGTKGATIGFYHSKESKYSLWEDYCTPDGKLVEYSCKNRRTRFNVISCACSEGKCLSPPYCMDTDGGYNINSVGKAVGVGSDGIYFMGPADECFDSKKLIEVSCGPEGFKTDDIECPNGCSSGKCLREGEAVAETPETALAEPVAEETTAEVSIAEVEGISCTKKTDCTLEEACIEKKCGKCSKDSDCGTSWKCNNEKCEMAPKAEEEIKCNDERGAYEKELRKQLEILKGYEKILLQAESKHNKPAPEAKLISLKATTQKTSPEVITPGMSGRQSKMSSQPTPTASSKKLGIGRSCTQSSQCQSGYCGSIQSSTGKGTCASLPAKQVNPVVNEIQLPKANMFA